MTQICILAGNKIEADNFARGQNLESDQYFYPKDVNDLIFRTNFHVLVIGSAGQNTPSLYFERIYELARKRGQIDRK